MLILKLAAAFWAGATAVVLVGASGQSASTGLTFEVASVKRNLDGRARSSLVQRPDGGLVATKLQVLTLITRAYPPVVPMDIVGLPGWASEEYFDVSATASLTNPTPEQRASMLRALLEDRFHLRAHREDVEQPVYELVLARQDGKLGEGIMPSTTDCEKIAAERASSMAPSPLPNFNQPLAPCSFRVISASARSRSGDKQGSLGDLVEAEMTMREFAGNLRVASGRPVVDRTGLEGVYKIRLNVDMMAMSRGSEARAAVPDPPPTVFTAVRDQLGLKLESARAPRESLVIDHIERPTENP